MSIFTAPLAAIFAGPMGETARYRPRVGAAFAVKMIPVTAGDSEMQIAGSMVVPELIYEADGAQFDIAPLERDTVLFGTTSYYVKSVQKVNDNLVYRLSLGTTR
jgi:hypothetical protein